MKILNLKVENIKKLVAIDITPDASVMKISGKNGAGKTSVLDAIWWALGGTNTVQDQPIRDGQQQASIKIDLGELKVERRFTPKGSTLFVTDDVGGKLKSPQAVLNKLLGQLTFDPLGFMRLDAKKQVTYLKELVGLDFTDNDDKREGIYDRRTEASRTLTSLESELSGITLNIETPNETVVVEDELTYLNEANAIINKLNLNVSRETVLTERLAELTNEVQAINSALAEIEVFAGNNSLKASQAAVAALTTKINNAATLNGYLKDKERHTALTARVQKGQSVVAGLTDEITALDEAKKAALAKAKFPVAGLGFNDTGVVFNNIPLDQSSFAEQLKVSTAMAMAFNPDLRVIRITDGSMLDRDSMAVLERIADANDFQVWVEIVDDSGEVGVYIEDGQVVSDKENAA